MNKRTLLVTLLLVSLVGTMALAQGSIRFGGNYITRENEASEKLTADGYELFGKMWFSELPKLTINMNYANTEAKHGDTKYADTKDLAVNGEYRLYNETGYGFAGTAGFLQKSYEGTTINTSRNYLTVGGKGNFVLGNGLQAIGDVSYAFNSWLKEENDPEITILTTKIGAEYDLEQVPGLKLNAYYVKNTFESEGSVVKTENTNSGYGVGASYAFSF